MGFERGSRKNRKGKSPDCNDMTYEGKFSRGGENYQELLSISQWKLSTSIHINDVMYDPVSLSYRCDASMTHEPADENKTINGLFPHSVRILVTMWKVPKMQSKICKSV